MSSVLLGRLNPARAVDAGKGSAGKDSSATSAVAESAEGEGGKAGGADAASSKAPAADPQAISKLEAAGARVMPLYSGSELLQVGFASGEPATDAAMDLLKPIAEQLTWLDLAGAKLSPEKWATLAELKNLARLHLEKSSIDDAALAHLDELSKLEYLNLYDTSVTDAGLAGLKGLKNLKQLYLWKTKASFEAAKTLEAAVPGLRIDLGWDHPALVRIRAKKELKTVKQSASDAASRVKELEQQLDAAKKDQERVDAQLKELQGKIDGDDGKKSDGGEAKTDGDDGKKSDGGKAKAEAGDAKPDRDEKAERGDAKPDNEAKSDAGEAKTADEAEAPDK